MGHRTGSEAGVTSVISVKGWKFVKTKFGQEFCLDRLMFKGRKLTELDCYRFDEYGTRISVSLKPSELLDTSSIAEFLN